MTTKVTSRLIDSVANTQITGLITSSQLASNAVFPSGTTLLFHQTSAPTGWTQVTTYNDYALRVVNGTAGVGTGGSVAFSTAFTSRSVTGTTDGTTLSTSQIPGHSHLFPGDDQLGNASGYHGWTSRSAGGWPYDATSTLGGGGQIWLTSDTGGGGSHNHTFTGTAINLSVRYVDVIIATKN